MRPLLRAGHRPDRCSIFLALAIGSLVGLAPVPASAYCRTHTCQADHSCVDDVQGCPVGGKPLFWPRRCISFSVQENGSLVRGISVADAESVLQTSYSTWAQARCADGQTPSIDFRRLDPVACGEIEFNECDENANIWVFRDAEWPYDDGGRTLAQTWVHFDTRTGKIYDADVEVNTYEFDITTRNAEQRSQFIAIATHEIGHVFGLDHSPDIEATMYESYSQMTDISVLTPDDINGLCAIYPADRSVGACNPTPSNGFSRECGSTECEEEGCCATAPGRHRANAGWAILLGGLALVLLRGRRMGRRRA